MLTRAAIAGCLALALVGCRRAPPRQDSATQTGVPTRVLPAPSASAAEPPALVPGKDAVYGFPIPASFRVLASFPGEIHAGGEASIADLTTYVQERVDAGNVELGGEGVVFPAARVKGGDAARVLRIEAHAADTRAELVLRDVTPVPKRKPDTSVSEVERWKRAGLNPDGTPLDPMTLR